jgi:hypothetical protein
MPAKKRISDGNKVRYNFYKNPSDFPKNPRSSPILPFPVLKTTPHPPLWQDENVGVSPAIEIKAPSFAIKLLIIIGPFTIIKITWREGHFF